MHYLSTEFPDKTKHELIDIAKATKVGKLFLASYKGPSDDKT